MLISSIVEAITDNIEKKIDLYLIIYIKTFKYNSSEFNPSD